MKQLCLFVLLWCISWGVTAQDHVVHFAKGDQQFPHNATTVQHQDLKGSFYQGRYRLFLQFDHLLSLEEQQTLKAAGVRLLEYIPDRVYAVSLPAQLDLSRLAQYRAPVPTLFTPFAPAEIVVSRDTTSAGRAARAADGVCPRLASAGTDPVVATSRAGPAAEQPRPAAPRPPPPE